MKQLLLLMKILKTIIDSVENYNITLIIITHNKKLANRMKNIINIEDFITKIFMMKK